MSGKKRQISLSQKIFGILFFTCFGLGSASIFLFERAVREAEHEKVKTYGLYAQGMSERIAAQFYERYGDVKAFALNDVLHSGKQEQIIQAFNQFASLYAIYDLILFVDKNGKYIASNNKSPTNNSLNTDNLSKINFSETPWFKAVINGSFTEDKSKGFSDTYFEDAHIDKIVSEVYGQDMYGTGFSTVVKSSSGNILGVLTARAGFRWVEFDFISLYKQLQKEGLASTALTLIDKNGVVLVDYNPADNGGSLEVKRDFQNVILKLNLAQAGQTGVKEILDNQVGFGFANNVRTQENFAIGYSPVKSQKFIDSIGWGVMIGTKDSEVTAELTLIRFEFYGAITLLVFISCLIAVIFSTRLSKSLTGLAEKVSTHSVQVANTSFSIASASNQLSEATHEQAAALQETVAAIEEISNMVNKNAEVAHRSTEVSNTSEKAAQLGKKTVDSMIIAINDISSANAKIMDEMEVSNQEISNIVKVISEIGNKTKIINDIVFQTKLLSFNASVEAARAGEHGKGFAVVAEEVGNLAQMSGNAAKEISTMLEASVEKVENIVTNNKNKISTLVSSGREKVEAGTRTAQECGQVLDGILQNVTRVNQLVSEISHASQEQAQGVQEVTKAMSQLDQVTQQNASIAQQSSASANELNSRSSGLKGLAFDLLEVVGVSVDIDSTSSKDHIEEQTDIPKTSESTAKIRQAVQSAARVAQKKMPAPAKKSESHAAVLKFPEQTAPINKPETQESPIVLSQAAGDSGKIPLADDPRFRDV